MKLNLAVILAKKGIMYKELADGIGMSQNAISNIANQKVKGIEFDTLEKICMFLNITPNDLLVLNSESEKLSFGERIKKLRLQDGWTQEQFADRLEVSAQVISNYERDYREPEFSMLVRMAMLFRVTTDYLLGYEVEK